MGGIPDGGDIANHIEMADETRVTVEVDLRGDTKMLRAFVNGDELAKIVDNGKTWWMPSLWDQDHFVDREESAKTADDEKTLVTPLEDKFYCAEDTEYRMEVSFSLKRYSVTLENYEYDIC